MRSSCRSSWRFEALAGLAAAGPVAEAQGASDLMALRGRSAFGSRTTFPIAFSIAQGLRKPRRYSQGRARRELSLRLGKPVGLEKAAAPRSSGGASAIS